MRLLLVFALATSVLVSGCSTGEASGGEPNIPPGATGFADLVKTIGDPEPETRGICVQRVDVANLREGVRQVFYFPVYNWYSSRSISAKLEYADSATMPSATYKESPSDAYKWVEIKPQTFVLKPMSYVDVEIALTVPRGQNLSSPWSFLLVFSETKQGAGGLSIVEQMAARVIVTMW